MAVQSSVLKDMYKLYYTAILLSQVNFNVITQCSNSACGVCPMWQPVTVMSPLIHCLSRHLAPQLWHFQYRISAQTGWEARKYKTNGAGLNVCLSDPTFLPKDFGRLCSTSTCWQWSFQARKKMRLMLWGSFQPPLMSGGLAAGGVRPADEELVMISRCLGAKHS